MTKKRPNLQKPQNVILAIRLLGGSLALGVFNTAFNWKNKTSHIPSDFPINKDLFALFASLSTFAIMLWIILKISSGRNWARILFLCGFIIGLPFCIPMLREMINLSTVVVFIASAIALLQLAALGLLFSKTGNTWFKTQKELQKKQ